MNFLRNSVRAFAVSKTSDKLISVYLAGYRVCFVEYTGFDTVCSSSLIERPVNSVLKTAEGTLTGAVCGVFLGTFWPILAVRAVASGFGY